MALLDDIATTIREMSDEELFEALKDIRHNRTKETIILTKAREKKNSADKIIGQMTPEQAKALLAQLGVTV